MMMINNPKALYIHIPFCDSICSYCSFNKRLYDEALASAYIDNVIRDLERIPNGSLRTIYIGGGTPLALSYQLLDKLLKEVVKYLDLETDYEFTLESNVENIEEKKVELLIKYKVNRLSIGIQTFNEKLLLLLNRKHTIKDVDRMMEILNKYHFDNVNFDLIYGIPLQSLDDFKFDLSKAISYSIKHLSCYSLTIDEHTKMYNEKIEEMDEDSLRDMADFAFNFLTSKGFNKYEVSNFALSGYESKHNLTYWKDENYYGIGIGASGYEDNVRYTNRTSMNDYLKGIRKFDKDVVDSYNHEYEFIMLNLRTVYGLDLIKYKEIFNKDFKEVYKEEIDTLISRDLVSLEDNILRVKDNNFMILDSIIIMFLNKLDLDNI